MASARGNYQRQTYFTAGMSSEAAGYAAVLRGDPCSYCDASAGTVDHILPVSQGGPFDAWDNLTAACRACNGRTQHRSLLRFLWDANDPNKLQKWQLS